MKIPNLPKNFAKHIDQSRKPFKNSTKANNFQETNTDNKHFQNVHLNNAISVIFDFWCHLKFVMCFDGVKSVPRNDEERIEPVPDFIVVFEKSVFDVGEF